MENPKENRKVSRERNIETRAKALHKGLSGLKQTKSDANSKSHEPEQTSSTESSFEDSLWCDDNWSYDECKHMCAACAPHRTAAARTRAL